MSVASTNAPWRIGNSERAIYFEMKNIKIADVIEKIHESTDETFCSRSLDRNPGDARSGSKKLVHLEKNQDAWPDNPSAYHFITANRLQNFCTKNMPYTNFNKNSEKSEKMLKIS